MSNCRVRMIGMILIDGAALPPEYPIGSVLFAVLPATSTI